MPAFGSSSLSNKVAKGLHGSKVRATPVISKARTNITDTTLVLAVLRPIFERCYSNEAQIEELAVAEPTKGNATQCCHVRIEPPHDSRLCSIRIWGRGLMDNGRPAAQSVKVSYRRHIPRLEFWQFLLPLIRAQNEAVKCACGMQAKNEAVLETLLGQIVYARLIESLPSTNSSSNPSPAEGAEMPSPGDTKTDSERMEQKPVAETLKLKNLETRPDYASGRPFQLRDIAERLTEPTGVKMAHWLKSTVTTNGAPTVFVPPYVLSWNQRYFLPICVVRDGESTEAHVELREESRDRVGPAAGKVRAALATSFPGMAVVTDGGYPFDAAAPLEKKPLPLPPLRPQRGAASAAPASPAAPATPTSPTTTGFHFRVDVVYKPESDGIRRLQDTLRTRLKALTGNQALTLPAWNMRVTVGGQPSIRLEPDVSNGTIVLIVEIKGSGRLRIVRDQIRSGDFRSTLAAYMALVDELLELFPGLVDSHPISLTALGLAPTTNDRTPDNKKKVGEPNVTATASKTALLDQLLSVLHHEFDEDNVTPGDWKAEPAPTTGGLSFEQAPFTGKVVVTVVVTLALPEHGSVDITVTNGVGFDDNEFLGMFPEALGRFANQHGLRLLQPTTTEAADAPTAAASAPNGTPAPADDPPKNPTPPAPAEPPTTTVRPETRLKHAIETAAELTPYVHEICWASNFRAKDTKRQPMVKLDERRQGRTISLTLIYQDPNGTKVGDVIKCDEAKASETRSALERWLAANCPTLGILHHPSTPATEESPAPAAPPSPIHSGFDVALRGVEGPVADGLRQLFQAMASQDKPGAAQAISKLITSAQATTPTTTTEDDQIRKLTKRAEKAEHEAGLRQQTIDLQRTALNKYEKETVPELRRKVDELTAKPQAKPSDDETKDGDAVDEAEIAKKLQELQVASATVERLKQELETAKQRVTEQDVRIAQLTTNKQQAGTASSFAELEPFFRQLAPHADALRALTIGATPQALRDIEQELAEAQAAETEAFAKVEAWRQNVDDRATEALPDLTIAYAEAAQRVNELRDRRRTLSHEHATTVERWSAVQPDLGQIALALRQITALEQAQQLLATVFSADTVRDPEVWLTELLTGIHLLATPPTGCLVAIVPGLDEVDTEAAIEVVTETDVAPDAADHTGRIDEAAAVEAAPTVEPADDTQEPEPPAAEPPQAEPPESSTPIDIADQLCLESPWDDKGQHDLWRFEVKTSQPGLCQRQFITFWNAQPRVSLGFVFRTCDGLADDALVDRLTTIFLTLGITRKGAKSKALGFKGRCAKAGLIDEQGILSCPPFLKPEWVTQHNAWVTKIGLGDEYRVTPLEELSAPAAPTTNEPSADMDVADDEPETPASDQHPVEDRLIINALWDTTALRGMYAQAAKRGVDTAASETVLLDNKPPATLGRLLNECDGKNEAECDTVVRSICKPVGLKGQGLAARARFTCERLKAAGLFYRGRLDRGRVTDKLRSNWLASHNYAMKRLGLTDRTID